MYHPHSDEMVQMRGHDGLLRRASGDPKLHRVDRDFVFLLSAYDIDPGSYVPKVAGCSTSTLDLNTRVLPGIDHLVVAKGDRVRVRVGNLTMTNHPIHMHGYDFEVTCTDGGWVRPEARWPEVTIDIPVGAMRAYEFKADEPGDWALHCHKSHHTMNAMGHDVRTFIGVNKASSRGRSKRLVPDYMAMGIAGMADMGEMEMPLPDNTLPMMTGFGQFGPVEMGGMFTVVKVREGLSAGDYKDPGWYQHPPGTVAWEWKGPAPSTTRAPAPVPASKAKPAGKVDVVKPSGQHKH